MNLEVPYMGYEYLLNASSKGSTTTLDLIPPANFLSLRKSTSI